MRYINPAVLKAGKTSGKITILCILIGLILYSLAGCFVIPKEEEVLAAPLVKTPEATYDVRKIERRNFIKTIRIYGQLVPLVQKNLFFRYQGGRLINLYVDVGDHVKKGNILAELNMGNLESQIDQKKLVLQKLKIVYEMLKAKEANKFELEIADIDIKLAEIQLKDLHEKMKNSKLVSPITGSVIYIDAEEGDYVDAFKVIIKVVDPTKLILICPGYEVKYFPIGMEVDVNINNIICKGKIIMTPVIPIDTEDETQDTITIEIPDLPEDVSMNDTGKVSLVIEKSENTIVIPRYVLHYYSGRTFVNVLVNGLKEERDVEIGIETAAEVEIVAGLSEGEYVILR